MRIQMYALLLLITSAAPVGIALAGESRTGNAQSPAKYTGSAQLIAPPPTSADGRYRVNAELHSAKAATLAKSSDRFSLIAQLQPSASAKALSTACGPVVDAVFKNGFE